MKVKFIRTDLEEVIDPSRMVWCPAPYELPCQSLFFALLKYRHVLGEIKWAGGLAKLQSFRFVHLDNIKRSLAEPESTTANNTSVFTKVTEHAMEVDD